MTNHPNRSAYGRLIAKLQRISLTASIAPDVRRLAREEYTQMEAAQTRPPTHPLMSDAGYFNLYGKAAQQVAESQRQANDAERAERMDATRDSAERFLAAWGL